MRYFSILISKLRFLSPAEARIGTDGIDQLKQHPFFKVIDWSNLLLTKPLFVPKLESDSDTIYFDGVPQDDKENNIPNSDRLYSPAASRRKSKFSQQKSFSVSFDTCHRISKSISVSHSALSHFLIRQ
jgi:hypothetical protein